MFQLYFGDHDDNPKWGAIDRFEDLCIKIQLAMYFFDMPSRVDDTIEDVRVVAPSHIDYKLSTFAIFGSSMYIGSSLLTYPTWTPYDL